MLTFSMQFKVTFLCSGTAALFFFFLNNVFAMQNKNQFFFFKFRVFFQWAKVGSSMRDFRGWKVLCSTSLTISSPAN